ncbi:hypothetical protein niasHT_009107 [Heterodera trifolii]|uniref:Uncharacterized protein n=1 Tax=Heterodera trifolii TaxID=157864 RepID=A0ABD2M5V7_9BILA
MLETMIRVINECNGVLTRKYQSPIDAATAGQQNAVLSMPFGGHVRRRERGLCTTKVQICVPSSAASAIPQKSMARPWRIMEGAPGNKTSAH